MKGFLLQSNDFLILNKDGVNVLMLAGTHSDKYRKPKVVKDQEGFDRMIHPLSVCDSLKIEKSNHIYFACQYYDNR